MQKKTLICLFCLNLFFCCSLLATEKEQQRRALIGKAVDYLRTVQAADGSFSSQAGIGPTAIVVDGLLAVGVKPSDTMIGQALGFLDKAVREDGGIYSEGGMYGNYESCIALMCFSKANKAIKEEQKWEKGPYDTLLTNCEKFVRSGQFTEQKEKEPDDLFYGGAGYGKHQRPDLSNTQFFIEALRSTGVSSDDPAIQKALVFVSRCQNLETESNTTAFASKNQDGGFIYTCVGSGESPAGETPDGGLRSYGSMTYAGLKSMIYAGLTRDDPRVKAAFDWAKKHYELKNNPGLGLAGLYYYYQTMSKTFKVLGLEVFESAEGSPHDWKSEFVETLTSLQHPNGAWINTESRWMEGDPNLVTGYVLLVLGDCE